MFWSAFLGVLAARLTYYFARPLLKKLKWKAKYGWWFMTTVIFLLAAIACLIVPNLWIFLLIFAAALFLFGVRNPRTGQVLLAEILGIKPRA